ncbi:MAG: serine hydrolase, partial [Oscillospiraceae bacterium]|nr:serine hydrolase [Oscillospiraceae bacterium]
MRKILSFILILTLFAGLAAGAVNETPGEAVTAAVTAAPVGSLEISAPSAILMEKTTGAVLFEKDADTPREPASVTKIMALLLTFEALEAGEISLDDTVTASAAAAGMGEAQIFLSEGERMPLRDILKSVVVA